MILQAQIDALSTENQRLRGTIAAQRRIKQVKDRMIHAISK